MSTRELVSLTTVLMLVSSPARSEVMVADSLEWLVRSSPQIARVTVVGVERSNPTEAKFTEATVRAKRVHSLKGSPPAEVRFPLFVSLSARPGESCAEPAPGEEFLVFYRPNAELRPLNLTHPAARGDHAFLTTDYQVLTTPQAVLKAVEDNLTRSAPKEPRRLEVPVGTPAFEALYSGSSCYLLAP